MRRIKWRRNEKKSRSGTIWLLAFGTLCVLAIATAKVQLLPDRRIMQQSQRQYWANIDESASRGRIEDRNGISLAISVPSTSYFIDPKFWNPANAEQLAPIFGAETAKKFSRALPGRFHIVGRNLDNDAVEQLEAKKIPGLYPMTEKQRIYPHDSLAFHVLGFCDIDELGQAGVELAWNHILYSPPRTRYVRRDSRGGTMDVMGGRSGVVKDSAGSITLTIDSRIQQILEWRLSEGAQAAEAGWAVGVCVDPHTGEIIALASYPTINANDRKNLLLTEAVRNNALGRVFEPGSIFKPISMAIALETGAATPSSQYNCKGTMKLFDRTMSDADRKEHGMQDLEHVLMNSCNIGMSLMSMQAPRYQAFGMIRQFGFGGKSEVEMAGEEAGLIKEPGEWIGTVPANIFIGQGIAVTPIQLVMAIASIANGGKLLKPYVVSEVRDNDGNVIHKGGRRVRYQVVSEETADFVRKTMRRVVAEGGGKPANSDKTEIAGKTGTAQIARAGEYAKGEYVASFVGFWPAEEPRYVMLITLGEPKSKKYYGGQIAAPVFKSIVEDVVRLSE